MKVRLVIYGLLLIIGLSAFCYQWFHPGASFLSYLRIQTGIHVSEVTEFFGDLNQRYRYGTPILVPDQGCLEYRRGTIGIITIIYDREMRIAAKEWHWNWHIWDDLFGPEIRE